MLGTVSVMPNVASKCCSSLLAKVREPLNLYQKLCFAAGFLLTAIQQNCFLNFHSTEVF